VRSAQAEERVRHRASAKVPITLRPMTPGDVPAIAAVECLVFSDPWPESFFLGELAQPLMVARVAEREGRLAGYSVAWLGASASAGEGSGHLGNLAVTPEARRRGVASALLGDLLATAEARGVGSLTLEVRASNGAAQALYRAHGFRLAGIRRGYYRDTGEDAMVMEWRAEVR
jgi:ribosomal-protein-alanine N-acetyltransferase